MPPGVRGIWWCLWGFFALSALSATSTSLLSDREVGTPSSDPGPSDLLHVVSYLLAITAVVMLVRRLHPERDREVWIDSAILTFAAASIVGTFVIAPMSAASNETGLTLGLTVAYPLLDLVILSVLVRLLVGSERLNPLSRSSPGPSSSTWPVCWCTTTDCRTTSARCRSPRSRRCSSPPWS